MAQFIFGFAIFIFSVVIHEVAHGEAAYRLGDDTAHRLGRLTLNPLAHIDPFGSVILPLLLALPLLFGQTPMIVGWAKPVPYDPRRLKRPQRDAGLIALAGPTTNILIAIVFAGLEGISRGNAALGTAFDYVIVINLTLAIFNMVPIPPLDGSKVLAAILPPRSSVMDFLERNSWILLIAFIVFGLDLVQQLVSVAYGILLAIAGR